MGDSAVVVVVEHATAAEGYGRTRGDEETRGICQIKSLMSAIIHICSVIIFSLSWKVNMTKHHSLSKLIKTDVMNTFKSNS